MECLVERGEGKTVRLTWVQVLCGTRWESGFCVHVGVHVMPVAWR